MKKLRGSFCLVTEDLRALLAPVRHSSEKSSPFRHEESGSGTGRRCVARDPLVMIGISLLQDINEALTSDHIDSASFRVVKEVVRITHNFGRCYCLASFRIENQQARWRAASNKQPVIEPRRAPLGNTSLRR